MKKGIYALLAVLVVLAMATVGCKTDDDTGGTSGEGTATVTSVTVSPAPATVAKGGTRTFTATVAGENNPAQTVTWEVTGGGTGTSISTAGVLTIASGETATTLTVKATSTVDRTKSGTAAVTVSSATVTAVTVAPKTATVSKGGQATFTATVTGTGSPPTTVDWTVTGGIAGTTISSAGVLSVAAAETAATLTVKAASTLDSSKSDTATVTVSNVVATVTTVTVAPKTASVAKGGTRTFTATVAGTGSPAQTVTWEVTGGIAGTAISTAGVLTVAAAETATSLTVKATSTVDNTKSDTATVTVTEAGAGWKVTFNADGGTLTPSDTEVTVGDGETVTEPAVYKVGFILDGWYTEAAFTTKYVFTANVTANLGLYAKWTACEPAPTILGTSGERGTVALAANERTIELRNETENSELGFWYTLPDGWANYKQIKVNFFVKVIQGSGMQLTPKTGNTLGGTDLGYPGINAGNNTITVTNRANASAAPLTMNDAIAFQLNTWKSGGTTNALKWHLDITCVSIELVDDLGEYEPPQTNEVVINVDVTQEYSGNAPGVTNAGNQAARTTSGGAAVFTYTNAVANTYALIPIDEDDAAKINMALGVTVDVQGTSTVQADGADSSFRYYLGAGGQGKNGTWNGTGAVPNNNTSGNPFSSLTGEKTVSFNGTNHGAEDTAQLFRNLVLRLDTASSSGVVTITSIKITLQMPED